MASFGSSMFYAQGLIIKKGVFFMVWEVGEIACKTKAFGIQIVQCIRLNGSGYNSETCQKQHLE